MIGREIIGKRAVTWAEVEELLSPITDPTYEQKATLDYVREVKKVDAAKAKEKVKALIEAGITEELAVKIVNVYPRSVSELHPILVKEKGIGEDAYEKILNIL